MSIEVKQLSIQAKSESSKKEGLTVEQNINRSCTKDMLSKIDCKSLTSLHSKILENYRER